MHSKAGADIEDVLTSTVRRHQRCIDVKDALTKKKMR